MDSYSVNFRIKKRWVRTALIVLVTAMIVAPITAYAADRFTDVPDSNTFHDDISWLADADVTKGCNPPANTLYCPSDFVTRGQMAAFLHRLADNQVVDAGALQGNEPSDFVSSSDLNVTAGQGYDWFEAGFNVALEATGTPIVEASLTAPSGGHVLVIGNAAVGNSGTGGSFHTIWIEVNDGSCGITGLEPNNPVSGATTYAADGTADDYSTAVHGLAAVAAGPNTVTLCGANSAGDGDAFNAAIVAQFIGAGSVSTLTSPLSTASSTGAAGPASD